MNREHDITKEARIVIRAAISRPRHIQEKSQTIEEDTVPSRGTFCSFITTYANPYFDSLHSISFHVPNCRPLPLLLPLHSLIQFVQGAGCRGKGETYWSYSSFLLFLRENGVRTPSKNDFFDFFFSLPTVLALLALLVLRDPSGRAISSIWRVISSI